MTDNEMVVVERDGHVMTIGVNRPEKRNAWNVEIIQAVCAAYTELDDDPDLRVGVVHGFGDHFTGGLDLMSVLPAIASGEPVLPPDLRDPWDFMGEPCRKPIVVAVQGACFTLGIELILASQVAIAAEDTRFAQLEVARGILPLGGATFRLPAKLGPDGMRYLLTAEQFDAPTAHRLGLVTEVVPAGQQLDRAMEVARTIAANAPLAVQASLAGHRAAERPARDAAAAHLRSDGMAVLGSEDAMEAATAAMEKRIPEFKGK